MWELHLKRSWADIDKIRKEMKSEGIKIPTLRSCNLKAGDKVRSQVVPESTGQGGEQSS